MSEATETKAEGKAKDAEGSADEAEKKGGGAGSRTKGLTSPDFEGVGTGTLKSWQKYWQNKEKYEKDGHDEKKASAEVAKLQKEIDARAENRSKGGPQASS